MLPVNDTTTCLTREDNSNAHFRYMWLKPLLIAVSVLLSSSLQAQDSSSHSQAATTIDYTIPGAPMPPLLFMSYKDTLSAEVTNSKKRSKRHTPNSGTYTLTKGTELGSNGNLLVMIFSPECSHCKATTAMLQQNIDLYKRSGILLLTTGIMKEYIPEFAASQSMKKYPSMHLGFDSSGFVNNTFLYQPLPQINIYSQERKLIKTFTGEIPVDSLRQYID